MAGANRHRPPRRAALAACLALGAMTLGACDVAGSGGEIPPNAAAGLQGALSDLEGAVVAGSCRDARDAVALFRERVDALQDVEDDTSERLEAGAERLETLVQDGVCAQEEEVEATTTTTTEEETTTPEPKEEKEKEKEEKEEGEEATKPPEGEKGPNAPPGPEGNDDEEGISEDSGTGGVGDAGIVGDTGVAG